MMNLNAELIDLWTKSYSKRLVKYTKFYLFKSKKVVRNIKNHNWKQELSNVEDSYYLNLALRNGASQEIPFSTLILLGKSLNNEATKKETKAILADNFLSYEGFAFQLDDLENQIKIRKALRTNHASKVVSSKAA